MNKNIIIYGAGKIGRGFAADIFMAGGYRPIFADTSKELIDQLNAQGSYTIIKLPYGAREEIKVTDYQAMLTCDERLPQIVSDAGLMAVSVFVDAFDSVAEFIVKVIKLKFDQGDTSPLNVVTFANVDAPQVRLMAAIDKKLTEQLQAFSKEVLSVIGSLVICVAVQPTKEQLEKDPLVVVTDGHPTLPVQDHFLGERPASDRLTFHDNIEVLEKRKLHTYNLAHASIAYMGFAKGYSIIADAIADPEIERNVRGALAEVCEAYERAYDMDPEEMKELIDSIILKFKNTNLKDTIARVGGDPIRKLGRNDRVIGAAIFTRNNGVYPYYLMKVAACGLLFNPEGDAKAAKIQASLKTNGLDAAIRTYMGLHEKDLIYGIKEQYKKVTGDEAVPENSSCIHLEDDIKKVEVLHKAFTTGFFTEKEFRGCGQGTLLSLMRLTGIEIKDLFRAGTGLSGGMSLCGDGVCGGYSGGILFMGYLRGRDYDRMIVDGDKENQYFNYDCSQRLHDRFVACYGTPICKHIHEGVFNGEYFILRTKARRDEFEEAGAHAYVCTSVVGLATAWVAEILMDTGLYEF